jgi:hypothetical protein
MSFRQDTDADEVKHRFEVDLQGEDTLCSSGM